MRAQLHLLNESTSIDIELPEAQALQAMRARLDIYSNIDHILWCASSRGISVETKSTHPNPANSLRILADKLLHATCQAKLNQH